MRSTTLKLFAASIAALLLGVVGCGPSRPVPVTGTSRATPPIDSPRVVDTPRVVEGLNLRRDDIKDFPAADVLQVPYILWGGDVATYHANGGENTTPDSIFGKHGLKLRLVRDDDFPHQVKDYKEGKSPFLRGTVSMLGQVSDDIGGDGRTRPVVFLQLTWSAGDHLVSREGVRRINDLPGKKIALQKNGPHVGMLNDILLTARMKWDDIKVVWTDDVTGDKGPAEAFRKDSSIDACFCITPDMTGLTGGFDKTGDGKNKTVSGAHVLVSTADMKRSIADVYACRKDFYDKHRDIVEKFAAGYLKATEELVAIKKDVKDKPTPQYKAILAKAQKMFGKDVASDDDADGLISDAVFVGLPGNYAFFKDSGNLSGFDAKQKAALDMAMALKDISKRLDLLPADFDYAQIKKLGDLSAKVDAPRGARFAANPKEKNVLYSFNVYFGGGQSDFPEAQYANEFQRAVEQASLFGNAIISIKGHANPQDLTWGFRDEVLRRGIVTERGTKFFRKDGKEFDMNDMKKIIALIDEENLGNVLVPQMGGRPTEMRAYLELLQDLSEKRAAAVRKAVVDYANHHAYRLDQSQMKSGGLGGTEPVLVFPRRNDIQDGGKNRRVEFRIIQVGVEAINPEEFDF
jgi:ABC-type nitrate/sulfonate/bicarbonate transport system substrate-binding protein